ncbi:GNAT family N-acetyltransferase [Roseivivax sediminis]|nr:GNAT family N-acetyltransferase [Roseivivax sediminis]
MDYQTEDQTGRAITLEPFADAHLAGAMRLSAEVGWPHREEDWRMVLSVSRGVAAVAGGNVVGTALCSDFGPVAAINMIIVDENMRGRRLGRRLMEAVLEIAGDRECRLVGTEMGLPLYRKLGFEATGQIVQHQGIAVSTAPEQPVATAGKDHVSQLVNLDRAATGLSRSRLLEAIAAAGEALQTDGGVAMVRPFGRGRVLGPILAKSDSAARALMSEAARRSAGSFLRVDMPESHALGEHAETLGLVHAGGGTAMTRKAGARPSTEYSTYALVSQALG